MPIDRPDGRHFCDPGSAVPDGEGMWVCPGDGVRWAYDPIARSWVMVVSEPVEQEA
jgi:hypothetical protein